MARRDLPPLELLISFEAAARQLSFTKAGAELFLTQSAISRQVQALEQQLGVPLFQRRHRALALTDAGQQLYNTTVAVLRELRATTTRITRQNQQLLTVTTMVTFAALWLVPRLPAFRKAHPNIDVHISANNELVDIERDRIDVAIRYLPPDRAPRGALQLFGESVEPLCSPQLLDDPARPLKTLGDLQHQVLLHMDDAASIQPWLDWPTWFTAMGLPPTTGSGALYFSHYDQMIQAALEGQGVVMGRMPLLARHVDSGRLVAPFKRDQIRRAAHGLRGYFLVSSAQAVNRPEVGCFIAWLLAESGAAETAR